MASNNSNPSSLRHSTRERRPVKYYGGQYDEQMKDYAPGAPTPTTSAIVAGNGVDEEPSAVVTDPVVNNLPRSVTPETSSELTEVPESPKPASASSVIVILQPTSTWVSRPGLGKLKTRKAAKTSPEQSLGAVSSEAAPSETVTLAAASAEVPRRRVLKPKTRKPAKGPVPRQPSRKTQATQEEEPQEPESYMTKALPKHMSDLNKKPHWPCSSFPGPRNSLVKCKTAQCETPSTLQWTTTFFQLPRSSMA
jgi:hypothetical protein